MSALVSGLVTYVGSPSVIAGAFIDAYAPMPGKSEWGMDTLERHVRGCQPNLAAYYASLAQGQTYIYSGTTFYLQTFSCDNDPVFPGVRLFYKGLIAGIPAPLATGSNIEQSLQIAATFTASYLQFYANNGGTTGSTSLPLGAYASATRNIRYITRQTVTRYISTSRPTAGTYGLDVQVNPTVISSVIHAQGINADGSSGGSFTFSGANAPPDVVTALTPATYVLSIPECMPVVGSPYFECTDRATLLYVGSRRSF